VALAVVTAVSACSETAKSGASGEGAAVSGLNLTAETDPETGAITFPYDRLRASVEEVDILATASKLTTAECAKAQGVDFRASASGSFPSVYKASNYFGVWIKEHAERYAFLPPMTEADMEANGIKGGAWAEGDRAKVKGGKAAMAAHNSKLSPSQKAVVAECARTKAKRFNLGILAPPGPWSQPIDTMASNFNADERVKSLYNELHACFVDAGLKPNEEAPGVPIGAKVHEISEEQIQMALRVVDCKHSSNLVPRLSAIMAELQAPIIEKYAPELAVQRERIDTAVAAARQVISRQSDQ